MSGNISNAGLTPVSLGTIPKEVSKVCTVKIRWAADTYQFAPFGEYKINLLQQYQSGQFTSVQCVYVDNSTVPYQVRLTCDETAAVVVIPPLSQGFYDLLTGQAPSFTLDIDVPQTTANFVPPLPCSTILNFLNVPQAEYQRLVQPSALNTIAAEFTFVSAADHITFPQFFDITQPVTLIPPSVLPNRFTAISSVSIATAVAGGYAGPTLIVAAFNWIGGAFSAIYVGSWVSAAAPTNNVGNGYQGSQLYSPALIAPQANLGVNFQLLGSAPTTGGPLPGGTGYIIVNISVTYGTVLIQ